MLRDSMILMIWWLSVLGMKESTRKVCSLSQSVKLYLRSLISSIFFSFALYIGASWEGLLHWWAHKRALQWLCPWRLYCRYVSSREVFIRFAYSWACRKGFILSCDKLCTYNVNFRRRVFSGIDSAEILINCAQKKMCKYNVPGKYDDWVHPNQNTFDHHIITATNYAAC